MPLDRVRVARPLVEKGSRQHRRPFPAGAAPEEPVVVRLSGEQGAVHEEAQLDVGHGVATGAVPDDTQAR
ncbi:hypothetical protein JOC24_002669 [Streptomyces sp. HB132]|nr:hypothetical protein [Streptomyces sp. HB132]